MVFGYARHLSLHKNFPQIDFVKKIFVKFLNIYILLFFVDQIKSCVFKTPKVCKNYETQNSA